MDLKIKFAGRNLIERLLLLVPLLYVFPFTLYMIQTSFSWKNILLSFAIIIVHSLGTLVRYSGKFTHIMQYLLTLLEYTLILMLFYGSQTGNESIAFAVFTIDVIFTYEPRFGVSFAYIGYTIYLILWGGFSQNIADDITGCFNYCIFIAALWASKVLLEQRDKILQLNRTILEQSSYMEDLAKLKERNRIAEEVHNTVGHKLSVAIVTLEGASLLYEKKPEEAREKLNIARLQLKEGLNNIREEVRMMHFGNPAIREQTLRTSLEDLIRGVEIQTDIHIRFEYDLPEKLLSLQEHVLFNAVKEGITNAIRHAGAKNIRISITQTENHVELIIWNDGHNSGNTVEGFGLKTIRENSMAIGGKATYECAPDSFKLCLYLPVVGEN